MICAQIEFIFVFGGYHSSYAHGCPDGWHITGQCLLGYLIVLLTLHRQSETLHWSTPLSLHCWVRKDLPRGIHDSKLTSFGRSLLPWLRVNANENMIRNLSLTLENIIGSAAKTIAIQEKPLDPRTKGVLDNKIALDYLLDEQKRCLCCGQYSVLHLD